MGTIRAVDRPAAGETGASIACSGVCLTVVARRGRAFRVNVSAETVRATVPGMWAEGRRLNLERALRVGDELGGHIVTGHVDGVGEVVAAEPAGGSRLLRLAAPRALGGAIAPKGSIAVDGVSLTVNRVHDEDDRVLLDLNIVPHTAAVTTLGALGVGDRVNLEIDLLARYLKRLIDMRM
ncbi:riboflavin synthase [Thermaurantiacus sp.]